MERSTSPAIRRASEALAVVMITAACLVIVALAASALVGIYRLVVGW